MHTFIISFLLTVYRELDTSDGINLAQGEPFNMNHFFKVVLSFTLLLGLICIDESQAMGKKPLNVHVQNSESDRLELVALNKTDRYLDCIGYVDLTAYVSHASLNSPGWLDRKMGARSSIDYSSPSKIATQRFRVRMPVYGPGDSQTLSYSKENFKPSREFAQKIDDEDLRLLDRLTYEYTSTDMNCIELDAVHGQIKVFEREEEKRRKAVAASIDKAQEEANWDAEVSGN